MGTRRRGASSTRLGMLAIATTVAAASLVPAPTSATPAPASPIISVTEMTGPAGTTFQVDLWTEITRRGEVPVQTETPATPGPRGWAIWRNGSLTQLAVPPGARFMTPPDLNERGQAAASAWTCAVEEMPECTPPYVWTDGRRTEIPTDGFTAWVSAINDRGQVLLMPTGVYAAVVWDDDGDIHTLPLIDDDEVLPTDINDRGQVALLSGDDEATHVKVWQVGGDVVELDPPPGYDLSISNPDINDRGHVAARASNRDDEDRVVLWRGGQPVDLGTLGGGEAELVELNDRDEVVGHDTTGDGRRHGFLWRRGRMIDLGSLGGDVTVTDVNDRGQIVGYSETGSGGPAHAFLWQDGRMVDLGAVADPGADSAAYAINDRGQIVGEVDERPVIWTVR